MKKIAKNTLTGNRQKTTLRRMPIENKFKSMKSKGKSNIATGQQQEDLLTEAMKQPGVQAIMDVFEAADKYDRQSTEYANFIDWQRFPSSFSSCDTTQPA